METNSTGANGKETDSIGANGKETDSIGANGKEMGCTGTSAKKTDSTETRRVENDSIETDSIKIGERRFALKNRTYIMGILNVTPDSFSDGGKWNGQDAALKHVGQMVAEGADIVDIGGESTRPGYVQVSDDEELERVVPVIERVKSNFGVPVSVDTYKSKVAKAAVAAGADLVNDIWGLKYDADMAGFIADAGVSCCLMHNRDAMNGKAQVHGRNLAQDMPQMYGRALAQQGKCGTLMEEIAADLRETVWIAKEAGIRDDKILLDPGIGFAKTYEDNLEAIRCLGQLKEIGYPLLLGASRKSVIGITLGLPVMERAEGTIVTTVFAVLSQCLFVRVHDVKENARAIRMAEAILYK